MSDRTKLHLSALAVGTTLGVTASLAPNALLVIGAALGVTASIWGVVFAASYFDNPYR